MVSSQILKDKIQYKESRQVDEEDIGYNSSVYDYEIHDTDIEIVLGKEKHNYTDFNVIFYPVYLFHNDKVIVKIGVFEIEANNMINSLDEDGDIMIENGNIILFSFATLEFIKKKMVYMVNKMEKPEIDLPGVKKTESVELLYSGTPLEKETKEIALTNQDEFVTSQTNSWVENAMKNNNFSIIDIPGDGDCFFTSIQKAFEKVGKTYTILELRKIVSSEVTQELVDQYKMIYNSLKEESERFDIKMKEQKKTNIILKKRHESTLERKQSDSILEEANQLHTQYGENKTSKESTSELLGEFSFMEDIDSIDNMKNMIETNRFWADTWAVSVLEYKLNIKVIILSEEYFDSGDVENILLCTQINDDKMTVKNPSLYVMLGHNMNHYYLITYKNKGLLKFDEIPYDIKVKIILKCMENDSGDFYLIDEFKNMKEKIQNKEDQEEQEEEYGLYDKETVFMIHGKANSKPKPGKGNGEMINPDNMLNYHLLSKDKCCNNWRRKLSDDWTEEFKLDGKTWYSINHYMYANKYKKGFPDFYDKFALDSGSKISKDLEIAKHAISKTGKYKQEVLREDTIKEDDNVNTNELRETALMAKFSQNKDLNKMLTETKDAKIVLYIRGSKPNIDTLLMTVRQKI